MSEGGRLTWGLLVLEVSSPLMVGSSRLPSSSTLERLELWRPWAVGKGRGPSSGEGVPGWLDGVIVPLLLPPAVALPEPMLALSRPRSKGVLNGERA